jgi:sRNA-binding regulator protein Hfq
MPREVYAEELEQLLRTLEGVASARVLATQAGEIDRIYVTVERAADPRAVRAAVAAALVSAYGVPVEPSRIRVTLFREGLRPAEIPRFQVVRVEETLAAGQITAAVRVTWARGGEEKTATGRAHGPAGPANRLRTLAAATIEAVRDALEPAQRKVSVQQAAFVTFLDRPVALVGLSVPTPRGAEIGVGAALREDAAEAIVAAALDAVTAWLLQAAFAATPLLAVDRRERLEAMRHFVRATERGGLVAAPGRLAGEALREAGRAGPDAEPAVRGGPADDARSPNGDAGGAPGGEPAAEAMGDPDILADLGQIRPEQIRPDTRGGAAMSVHPESSRAGFTPPPRRPTMEEAFYQPLVEGRTPVHLRCRDGYELPRAVIKEAGTYSLLLETPAGTELVFKHAVISIRVLPPQTPEA